MSRASCDITELGKNAIGGGMPDNTLTVGPLLDDGLKDNLKKNNPETLRGCPLFSLSCLSVRPSVPELQSTPFDLGT